MRSTFWQQSLFFLVKRVESTYKREGMFKNVFVPQPNHPLPGRRDSAKSWNASGWRNPHHMKRLWRGRETPLPQRPRPWGQREPATKRSRACGGPRRRAVSSRKTQRKGLRAKSTIGALTLEQAPRVDFPLLGGRYELQKTCQAAIATMLSREGEQLAKWRAQQMRVLEDFRRSAMPIDAAWKRQIADVSAGVKNLRKSFNVVFLAILRDALEWPDVSLCSSLLRGFRSRAICLAKTQNIFAPKEEGEVREDYARFEKGWAEMQDHDGLLLQPVEPLPNSRRNLCDCAMLGGGGSG